MLQTKIIPQQATSQVNTPDENYTAQSKPDIETQAFTAQKYQLRSRLHKDSVLSNTNQSMMQSPQHTIIGTGAVNWDL